MKFNSGFKGLRIFRRIPKFLFIYFTISHGTPQRCSAEPWLGNTVLGVCRAPK